MLLHFCWNKSHTCKKWTYLTAVYIEAKRFVAICAFFQVTIEPAYFHYLLIKHIIFLPLFIFFLNKTKTVYHTMKQKHSCFDHWNFCGRHLTYELQSSKFCSNTCISERRKIGKHEITFFHCHSSMCTEWFKHLKAWAYFLK